MDITILRGDLLHGRGSYNEENSRIYFKVVPKGKSFDKEGQVARVQAWPCKDAFGKGCDEAFTTKNQRKYHRLLCIQ